LLYLIRVIRLIRRSRKRGIYLHENFHIWKKNKNTILSIHEGDISDINSFNDKVLCVMKGQGRNIYSLMETQGPKSQKLNINPEGS